jgi:hypothetical protein
MKSRFFLLFLLDDGRIPDAGGPKTRGPYRSRTLVYKNSSISAIFIWELNLLGEKNTGKFHRFLNHRSVILITKYDFINQFAQYTATM